MLVFDFWTWSLIKNNEKRFTSLWSWVQNKVLNIWYDIRPYNIGIDIAIIDDKLSIDMTLLIFFTDTDSEIVKPWFSI